MKHYIILAAVIFFLSLTTGDIFSNTITGKSRITSVQLYRNQATITRSVRISLQKGVNKITLQDLPPLLYNWSVKGKVLSKSGGRILSLEVSKHALTRRRQKRILTIEMKIKRLMNRDQILLDDLKNIRNQEQFISSILSFTNQTAAKELATRIPNVKIWNNTLNFVSAKTGSLHGRKRHIEQEREKIGKEIQKWEYELVQIAGYNYFRNYQALNEAIINNRGAFNLQNFGAITKKYGERDRILRSPRGKVDYEKKVEIMIYSPKKRIVDVALTYVIPQTRWNMRYDIRASKVSEQLDMTVFANLYQKTGEDWDNITLALSTGSPVNSIQPPHLYAWNLNLFRPRLARLARKSKSSTAYFSVSSDHPAAEQQTIVSDFEEAKQEMVYAVKNQGPNVEIALPIKQSVESSNRYQKKYIQEYKLGKRNNSGSNLKFYYELIPQKVRNGYLRIVATNTTDLPWLPGEAQIFLENEFMGKVSIPYTPMGKKRDIVLGIENRITSKKELVKKYEDTSGIFGGNRRIRYSYTITVENDFPKSREVIVKDAIPVSRNEKIDVEVAGLSIPYLEDKVTRASSSFAKGIRKWKFSVPAHGKKIISYDIIVTFDKDIRIRGLR